MAVSDLCAMKWRPTVRADDFPNHPAGERTGIAFTGIAPLEPFAVPGAVALDAAGVAEAQRERAAAGRAVHRGAGAVPDAGCGDHGHDMRLLPGVAPPGASGSEPHPRPRGRAA